MFVAYVNETDNGCDYTIACGKVLWELKANTREKALEELRGKVLGTFYPDDGDWEEGYHDECELVSVILYEILGAESVPLSAWYAQAEQMTAEVKQRNEDEAERRQYEELRKKFSDVER